MLWYNNWRHIFHSSSLKDESRIFNILCSSHLLPTLQEMWDYRAQSASYVNCNTSFSLYVNSLWFWEFWFGISRSVWIKNPHIKKCCLTCFLESSSSYIKSNLVPSCFMVLEAFSSLLLQKQFNLNVFVNVC